MNPNLWDGLDGLNAWKRHSLSHLLGDSGAVVVVLPILAKRDLEVCARLPQRLPQCRFTYVSEKTPVDRPPSRNTDISRADKV